MHKKHKPLANFGIGLKRVFSHGFLFGVFFTWNFDFIRHASVSSQQNAQSASIQSVFDSVVPNGIFSTSGSSEKNRVEAKDRAKIDSLER